jgi:hypothetical protein
LATNPDSNLRLWLGRRGLPDIFLNRLNQTFQTPYLLNLLNLLNIKIRPKPSGRE